MPKVSYMANCFDCGWTDFNAKGTASARAHAKKTGHTVGCVFEKDHIFKGEKK